MNKKIPIMRDIRTVSIEASFFLYNWNNRTLHTIININSINTFGTTWTKFSTNINNTRRLIIKRKIINIETIKFFLYNTYTHHHHYYYDDILLNVYIIIKFKNNVIISSYVMDIYRYPETLL